jgi:hypothetical protein
MANSTDPNDRLAVDPAAELSRRYPILKFFKYDHLPQPLQDRSKPFHDLAWWVANDDSKHPAETATALRKLLEAKDCTVRAFLP